MKHTLIALLLITVSHSVALAELRKVKVPGVEGMTVSFKSDEVQLWDGAGISLGGAVEVEADNVSLLEVGSQGGPRIGAKNSFTVEGDTFYVELPAGKKPRDIIEKIDKHHSCKPFYARLAAHWAPVIHQDEDDDCPQADYITAVNFDNDYDGENNWENTLDKKHAFKGNLLNEAVVYWWVVETNTHYYVGYADFHPRDWNDRDSIQNKFMGLWASVSDYDDQHENDMEGALLVVRKKSGKTFGEVELMLTQAHNQFWQYSNFKDQLRDSHDDVDGDLLQNEEHKPRLFLEAKGHGVYGSPKKTDYDPKGNGDGRTYRYAGAPQTNGTAKMICWSLQEDKENFLKPQDSSQAPKWLSESCDGRGTLPVDYSLRSITPLWNKQNTPLYTEDGSFRGTVHKDNAANPPWMWKDKDYEKDGIPNYTFFHEPALLYKWIFDARALGPVATSVIDASYERPSAATMLARN